MMKGTGKMKTYAELKEYIEKGKSKIYRSIVHNTTARFYDNTPGSTIVIKYHDTDICLIQPDNSRSFFTDGWKTYTTKERISDLLPQPFGIYQEKGIWYIWNYQTKEKYLFAEGITITADNRVIGAGKSPKKDEQLRKRIQVYSKGFMAALLAGKVNKPSGGDCWYCYLHTENGKSMGDAFGDKDHLNSHLSEKYYVGSLFWNAVQEFPISQMAKWELSDIWGNTGSFGDTGKSILSEQGYKSLTKYLYKQFGLVR